MRWFVIVTIFACVATGGQDLRVRTAAAEQYMQETFATAVASAPERAGHRQTSWRLVAQHTTGQLPEKHAAVTTSDDTYRYDPRGRRDPFESLVQDKTKIGGLIPVGIDPDRPRGPLERFDMSALKLVGILQGQLGRRGLIQAPDKKGYFVTVGMYMGQNGGQVVAIESDHLVIEEKFKDAEGNIVAKPLTLPLRLKKNNG